VRGHGPADPRAASSGAFAVAHTALAIVYAMG
jgi:hypothetical protein